MDEYYLQDSRQVVGNYLLFWRKDHMGYTTDIDDAHVFTLKEALSHRDTNVPWPVSKMRAVAKLRVDHQDLQYTYKEQRKLMAAKATEEKQ